MKRLLSAIFIISISGLVNAQQDCAENIFEANRMYKNGLLKEAIELASPCRSSGNITDQWRAEKLLAICYLAQGKTREARQSAERMIELNPTYDPSLTNDPKELVKLVNSVQVLPKFYLGLTTIVGLNLTQPQVVNSINGGPYNKEYEGLGSWQFGLSMGYNFDKNLSLHSGLVAFNKRYDISYDFDDKYEVNINERMTYLVAPLYLRFRSPLAKKLQAFVNLGGYAGRLINAEADFSLTKTIPDETSLEFSDNGLSSMNRKNKMEFGMLTGVGLSTNLKNSSLSLKVDYFKGINYNLTDSDNRYSNSDLLLNYFYLDDDLRLDNLGISLSYVVNINYKVYKTND